MDRLDSGDWTPYGVDMSMGGALEGSPAELSITLYVDTRTALSRAAVTNTRAILAEVDAPCVLKIVNLATWDASKRPLPPIVATPTLVRECASGNRTVVGDLSDHTTVLNRLFPGEQKPRALRMPRAPRLVLARHGEV